MIDPEAGFGELRAGHLGVRIAISDEEVEAAQALRYRIFYEEMGAHADAETAAARRDSDSFDPVADHLLVLDHNLGEGASAVVGTYRLIRREAAAKVGGFYSASEYDVTPLTSRPGPVLELGRSCVDAAYRGRPSMQLLWAGIAAYIAKHNIEVMFGCASLPGTDPDTLAMPLTYLHTEHLAPRELRPRAVPERFVRMDRMDPAQIDRRAALADLPPLVKGYLRLGGFVGDGAVIDPQFNTTDVCVVVMTELVTDKYFRHFERSKVS
ncbi:GNAT family N-acetyltransferase [Roseomonas marmotae]|uniref:L-ornithine N(alpha)-acyltransferase n=1 Tax=Roseomonas marmotae TaxID=2768161 RepID=A0ABS3K746_9PROT|nr:GNAT family N-acyltransferase [Roseomonas marmotae]MBO1073260.1 GNAT family N-acetyltransferase [Roseomonas marmotae]QTI79116.1 GNAT family N-acetyltransferase [Roseomonas marmotae]